MSTLTRCNELCGWCDTTSNAASRLLPTHPPNTCCSIEDTNHSDHGTVPHDVVSSCKCSSGAGLLALLVTAWNRNGSRRARRKHGYVNFRESRTVLGRALRAYDDRS